MLTDDKKNWLESQNAVLIDIGNPIDAVNKPLPEDRPTEWRYIMANASITYKEACENTLENIKKKNN